MNKYPTEITDETLYMLSDISDETIEKDINDTLKEIEQLQAEHNLYRNTTSKMKHFRQSGRLDGIHQRKEFVRFLTAVMDKRNEKSNGQRFSNRSAS